MTKRGTQKNKGWLNKVIASMLLLGACAALDWAMKNTKPSIIEASINAPSPPLICVEKIEELSDSIMPEIIRRKLGLEDTSKVERDTLFNHYLGLNSFIASPLCWKQLDGQLPKDLEKVWVNALVVDALLKKVDSSHSSDSLPPS